MVLIYFIAGIVALVGAYIGHQPFFRIEKLNGRNVLNFVLTVTLFFTILMGAYIAGYFPEWIAAPFMMFIYSFLGGFFAGYAWRLILLRIGSGNILYVHRSFWIDHAPAFATVMIILYGIYRTSLLLEQPVTGIRMASGLSLITFGIFGLILKVVPEFRSRGILFLDRIVFWRQVIAWRWDSEEVICIEYVHKPGDPDEQVCEFLTTIPLEDRRQIETVLESKMDDSKDERDEILGIAKQ